MPIAKHDSQVSGKEEYCKSLDDKNQSKSKGKDSSGKSGKETSSKERKAKKSSIKSSNQRTNNPIVLQSSSHKMRSSQANNKSNSSCSKLLLCGSRESDSKRKDVDESNLNDADSVYFDNGSKIRKSSRNERERALQEQTNNDSATASGDIHLVFEGTNNEPDSSGPVQGAHDRNSNKSCCFCWCCCCSCSCLSVKNNQEKSGKENSKQQQISTLEHYFNGNGEQPPSLDEIRLWSESFDKLMKCSWGRKVFRDFLKCEYSEENILFWLACEDLKKETNAEIIEEKARVIYEDYISILSPKEVSLDSRVREIINKNMVEPSSHTFDEAQLQIYTLMHRDSYPRFINSPMYRKLAQLPSPSRKESSA